MMHDAYNIKLPLFDSSDISNVRTEFEVTVLEGIRLILQVTISTFVSVQQIWDEILKPSQWRVWEVGLQWRFERSMVYPEAGGITEALLQTKPYILSLSGKEIATSFPSLFTPLRNPLM